MIYKNGNTIVEIKSDGTKIRYTPDNKPANPIFPESIDMKICNRCLMDCPMCHERSGLNGKLANLKHPLIDSTEAETGLCKHHGTLEVISQKLRKTQILY